jgi:ureidoacrylate peracid hydrolase
LEGLIIDLWLGLSLAVWSLARLVHFSRLPGQNQLLQIIHNPAAFGIGLDSTFQDSEFRVWLQSIGVNLLVFTGIDTSICVETSLREGFNIGYDVAIISDATASGDKRHYETTLERVRDYYGLVLDSERFKRAVVNLDKMRKGQLDFNKMPEAFKHFVEEFNLLDPRNLFHKQLQRKGY